MTNQWNIDRDTKKESNLSEYNEEEEDRWEDDSIDFEPESEWKNKWDEEE